jgi:hypothetical protein
MVLTIHGPPITVMLGRGRVVTAVTNTKVVGSLGLAAEVGLGGLFSRGILGGDLQELLHRVWGLTSERMDERLTSHAAGEGVDHISIGDVGDLIVLLREALDVLPEGLAGPLPVITQVP